MFAWLTRHPLLLWPIAWGFTGLGLTIADVGSTPRHGPLWAAFAFGMLAWAWAGSLSFHGELRRSSMLVWGLSYAFACLCAYWMALSFSSNDNLWDWNSPLVAGALGTALGPILHGLMGPRRWPPLDLAAFSMGWVFSSLTGAAVAMLTFYLSVGMVGTAARSADLPYALHILALHLGALVGTLPGGLLMGAVAMIARDHRPRRRVDRAELEAI